MSVCVCERQSVQHVVICCFVCRKRPDIQSDPDSYNGAVRENYTWSQDYTDVEVKVHVQPNIVKGKQVSWLSLCRLLSNFNLSVNLALNRIVGKNVEMFTSCCYSGSLTTDVL